MKAIDLSVYQTVSSWQKVYEDGIRFAVIKASQGATLDMGPMMAAALIAVIPTFILYLTCQKYFVQGVVTSGLKG